MQRHEIDPDTFMGSMMNECTKQKVPALLIYAVKEENRLMIRVRANRPAPEVQEMWDALHTIDDAMIDTAAKALAALDLVPWENLNTDQQNQVRSLASTAIRAALRTNAPQPPMVSPGPRIIT